MQQNGDGAETSINMKDTWQNRVRTALHRGGYESCMRRSLQTVILYESKRCLADKLASLSPCQRKAAVLDQCQVLLKSLEYDNLLHPYQREEVLWRTVSSRKEIDAEIAWKRIKGIEKELDVLAQRIEPYCTPERTHHEAVDALVQNMYTKLTLSSGQPHANWEHAHNHCVWCFRIYYNKTTLDPKFPEPVTSLTRPVVIPEVRARFNSHSILQTKKRPVGRPPKNAFAVAARSVAPTTAVAAPPPQRTTPVTAPHHDQPGSALRITLLHEVRQHLELLKEFEGVVAAEDLAQRKRELFGALPPVDAKRRKLGPS